MGDAWKNVDEVIVHAFLFVFIEKITIQTDMKSKHTYNLLLVIAFLLITCGGFIYLAFRPKSLLLFQLVDTFCLTEEVDEIRKSFSAISIPDFVVYSLPAGLWTASYLLIMFYTTRIHNRETRLKLSLPLPVSAVVLEIAQYYSLCPGTFDFIDLICYLVPVTLFIIYV